MLSISYANTEKRPILYPILNKVNTNKRQNPYRGPIYRKPHLPQKDCIVCGRPFSWRKKWLRCWDEVTHCSDACRKRPRPG
ncbi:MAG: DUF2256 domain-containing protein [Bacteroidetes bacterium]|nr:DUF2256 domain-containing protein [Bacteroidota bacterium]